MGIKLKNSDKLKAHMNSLNSTKSMSLELKKRNKSFKVIKETMETKELSIPLPNNSYLNGEVHVVDYSTVSQVVPRQDRKSYKSFMSHKTSTQSNFKTPDFSLGSQGFGLVGLGDKSDRLSDKKEDQLDKEDDDNDRVSKNLKADRRFAIIIKFRNL